MYAQRSIYSILAIIISTGFSPSANPTQATAVCFEAIQQRHHVMEIFGDRSRCAFQGISVIRHASQAGIAAWDRSQKTSPQNSDGTMFTSLQSNIADAQNTTSPNKLAYHPITDFSIYAQNHQRLIRHLMSCSAIHSRRLSSYAKRLGR